MATATMNQSGLLAWANSIRFTMACDPGRQLFADQIHTQGFVFLDSYLDNILGPKQELMIELVKTPGRMKVNKAKMTSVTSKLKGVVLSLEDYDHEKENVVPVNNFHRALLQVRDKKYDSDTQPVDTQEHKTSDTLSEQPVAQQEEQIPLPIIGKDHAPEIHLEKDGQKSFAPPHLAMEPLPQLNDEDHEDVVSHLPSRSEQNDLSVIAEDDESVERSRNSIHISPQEPAPSTSRSALETSLITDTNTTCQESQTGSVPQSMHPENATAIHSWNSPIAHANEALIDPVPTGAHVISSLNAPNDSSVPVHCPVSPHELIRKGSVPLFPNLPVPLALRKSMRAPRDPSMGIGLGSATPAPVGGKRSSWLIKAREAKAMEQNGKRTSTLDTTGMGTAGMKRKSGDILGDEVNGVIDGEEVNNKVAKLADGERSKAKDTGGQRADISTGAHLNQHHQPAPQLSIPILPQSQYQAMKMVKDPVTSDPNGQDGMLDRLKRTVEGLGARVGKSMGKSLGGTAVANALAEARAAAEARVAERERNKDEVEKRVDGTDVVGHVVALTWKPHSPQAVRPSEEGRLSISDLVAPQKHSKVFQTPNTDPILFSKNATTDHGSTSTTPPHSPPTNRSASFAWPSGPVFNKPPPVFMPPPTAPVANQQARAVTSGKAFAPNLAAPTFSMPMPVPLGLSRGISPPSLSNSRQPIPLSAQSTMESIASDRVFDAENAPAWMPTTQDTEYSFESQSPAQCQHVNDLDEDDSWPLDEKVLVGDKWTFGHPAKEDSLTWSTLPMDSQRAESRAESGPIETNNREIELSQKGMTLVVPGAFDKDTEGEYGKEYLGLDESEIEELEEAGKLTVSLVESNVDRMVSRSQSQLSMTSSSSSHAGFIGQASKLVNSVLGTGKKGKVELKSLQLAAVAAKKQQEEMDKKAARLKEMENRRQLALQRKTEEEKSKAMDQERKMKEDGERRKREREEHTDKRPLKGTVKKEEDNTKKRKVFVEIEKKPEVKKPALKALKPALSASTATKTVNAPKPASVLNNPVPLPALGSSTVYNTTQPSQPVAVSPKMADAKMTIVAAPSAAKPTAKGKGKVVVKNPDDSSDKQPSHVVQNKMAARLKARIQAAKRPESEIASENIELPEIVSDFSDSEDEDQPRTFDPPDWAQSPELRQALQMQSTLNPDDIFGAIRPLRMEELFRTRTARFRARTSSANWHGSDRLTAEEVREYTRRMGYQ